MFTASNIHYEIADRTRGIAHGGIGAIHALARQLGLIDAIDRRLHLLKIHLPYHESDHVLNLAYNALCDGTCLQDLELRRNDEVFLDALAPAASPTPPPPATSAAASRAADIDTLLDIFDDTRLQVWAEQPDAFFDQAILDMDGTLVETTGAVQAGHGHRLRRHLGLSPAGGVAGQHRRSAALVNRSGNRPSHEGAAAEVDRAIWPSASRGGFRQRAAARRHRLLADRAPGPLGRRPARRASSSATTPRPT